MNEKLESWNRHYTKGKSVLLYPDENLVRMLKNYLNDHDNLNKLIAVDLGCGSGRHIKLLGELGIKKIIGIDISYNALSICRERYNSFLLQAQGESIPLKDNSIDIVVSWGSLHYGKKKSMNKILLEISRILKKSGMLFGTLRTKRDTSLKRGHHIGDDTWITDHKEINKTTVSFYSEDELKSSLSIYRDYRHGIMERSTIGDIDMLISHWFFWAKK
jgi:ubiquinone/menaquinone biosynthesis C-methylase UbiE